MDNYSLLEKAITRGKYRRLRLGSPRPHTRFQFYFDAVLYIVGSLNGKCKESDVENGIADQYNILESQVSCVLYVSYLTGYQ